MSLLFLPFLFLVRQAFLPDLVYVLRRPALLLVQRDVTQRAQLEGVLEELSKSQLSMLCEVGVDVDTYAVVCDARWF